VPDDRIPEHILAEAGHLFEEAVLYTQLSLSSAYSYVLNRFDHTWKTIDGDYIAELGISAELRPIFSVDPVKFKEQPLTVRAELLCHIIGHFMCGHMSNFIQHDTKTYCTMKYGQEGGIKLFMAMTESMADTYVVNPAMLVLHGHPYMDVRQLGFDERHPPTNMAVLAKLEEMAGENPTEDDIDELLNQCRAASAAGAGGTGNEPAQGSIDSFTEEVQAQGTDLSIAEHHTAEVSKSMMTKFPGRKRGLSEGQMEELVRQRFAPPKAPFQQLLMHSISAALSTERRTSKTRLNRRLKYFMGRVYENTTKIVFIIDTSGSVTRDELQYLNSQLRYITQLTDDLYVVQADYGVQSMEKYTPSKPLERFSGRGGTAFMPALTHVADEFVNDMPQLVVYFTDGACAKLDDKKLLQMYPHTGLVWLLTPGGMTEGAFKRSISSVGRVIKIDTWT